MFSSFYTGKKVLVTGHGGFKGAWLCLWLKEMGAHVFGYSLLPDTKEHVYSVLNIKEIVENDVIADIRDRSRLDSFFTATKPDIVFHLAAQPLVRCSYSNPVETYETNVMGSLNVLEAARKSGSVKVFVGVTSDKCYENRETSYNYVESDPMGGYDMYSSSKGCAELLLASYRRSFLHGGKPFVLSSGRAGNVIGGGDWAMDRLMTDCIHALNSNRPILIRSPKATRPWQFVLEPLAGYLLLAEKAWSHGEEYAQGYNFGPEESSILTVEAVVESIIECWGGGTFVIDNSQNPHEAKLLGLNISKAKQALGFSPVYTAERAVHESVAWFKAFYGKQTNMQTFSKQQLYAFAQSAQENNITWSCGR